MIEVAILNYLKEALDAPCYMQRPEKAPGKYVLLQKTGSSKTNHISTATFAVQSFADTLYEAAKLNEEVKEAMEGAYALDDIGRVQLNSDYNYTDAADKQYRYQAVFVITHY